jgi:hypothetical protein
VDALCFCYHSKISVGQSNRTYNLKNPYFSLPVSSSRPFIPLPNFKINSNNGVEKNDVQFRRIFTARNLTKWLRSGDHERCFESKNEVLFHSFKRHLIPTRYLLT